MVVVPIGYGASSGCPSLRVPTTVSPKQLSVVVGVPGSTLANGELGMLPFAVMSAGQVIAGGVLSTTVTVAVQLLEAPKLSVAVNVTLVAPREYGPAGSWPSVSASPSGSDDPLSTDAAAVQDGPAATVTSWHNAVGA